MNNLQKTKANNQKKKSELNYIFPINKEILIKSQKIKNKGLIEEILGLANV